MGTIPTESKQSSNRQLERIEERLASIESKLNSVKDIAEDNSNSLAINKLTNGSIAVMICALLVLLSMGYRRGLDWYSSIAPSIPFIGNSEEPTASNNEAFTIDETKLKNGDRVANFYVSSQYLDPRRDNHRGVDIAAPSGTPYYAVGDITVKCYWDNLGGGNVAEFEYMELTWQLLHLQDNTCKAGRHRRGDIIGKMGSTGRSTGPHLHLQLRDKSRNIVEPLKGHVLAVLTKLPSNEVKPSNIELLDKIVANTSEKYNIPSSIIYAIAKHETGNYKAVIGVANYWGLKCVGNDSSCVTVKTNEWVNGSEGSYRLKFENCSDIERCSKILGNTLNNLNTSKQWDNIPLAIQSIGQRYATDPQWAFKIMSHLK